MTARTPLSFISLTLLWTLPPGVATAVDVDLMMVGNSITVGDDFAPGFRDELHTLLAAEPNHTFTWVGSSGSPPIQGHFEGGRRIDDFYPSGFGNSWGNGSFDITPDMQASTPEMVAIHLGTNDLNSQPGPYAPYSLDHGQSLQTQSGQLAELLLYLLQWRDGTFSSDLAHIVLSMNIPMQNRDQDVEDWNNAVIAIAEDLAEGELTGSPVKVTLADHYTHFLSNPDLFTFGPGDWMTDALHPNDAGYDEMATIYHPAIVAAVGDVTPPRTITDLAVAATDTHSVTIQFTAPGDDGTSGQAFMYDVRANVGGFAPSDFGGARQVVGEPRPAAPGQLETIELAGLLPGTGYTIAVKAVDDGGNRSTISNQVSVVTFGPPVVTLTFRDGENGYFGAQDNAIINNRPNDNYGNGTQLGVGLHGGGGALVNDVQRALIRFDLSDIPDTVAIDEATLTLYHFEASSADPVDVAAYRVTKTWLEGSQTVPAPQPSASSWNDARRQELAWSTPGVEAASDLAVNNDPVFDRFETPEDVVTLDGVNQTYAWDLTNAVVHWVDGTWQNDGVLLQSLDEGPNTRRRLRSSESADASRRPALTVTFTTITAVGETPAPAIAKLHPAFPNPFRSRASIRYELAQDGDVRLAIYDPRGRLVQLVADGRQVRGTHAYSWDGRTLDGPPAPSGVYFYRLEGPGLVTAQKIVLAR